MGRGLALEGEVWGGVLDDHAVEAAAVKTGLELVLCVSVGSVGCPCGAV